MRRPSWRTRHSPTSAPKRQQPGCDWARAKYAYLVSEGARPLDLIGDLEHPKPAVVFCRGVEADANATGHPPGDLHYFRAACTDVVLVQMANHDPGMDMSTAVFSMTGARMSNYEHSDYYPAATDWQVYYG